MNTALTLDSVLAEAMNFTPENRLELAERLVASVPLDSQVEAAQIEEMISRRSAVEAGEISLVPGDEALRQVRESVLGRA